MAILVIVDSQESYLQCQSSNLGHHWSSNKQSMGSAAQSHRSSRWLKFHAL